MASTFPDVLKIDPSFPILGLSVNGTPLTSAGFTSTAGVAFTVQFAIQPGQNAHQETLLNNTGAPVYRTYKGTATVGSYPIPTGTGIVDTISASAVSIFCASALVLNGTTAGLLLKVS